MRVTALGELAPGDPVNLERAMRADTRLGGHFVQGHVDAVGTVVDVRPDGEFTWVRIRFPQELAPQLVLKGSVAVDGISLTVAALGEDSFDVQIIPHTWTHTNLHGAHAGMRVNLECDIIGKYVARAMSLMTAQGAARS
jgi:riboflavin synthase